MNISNTLHKKQRQEVSRMKMEYRQPDLEIVRFCLSTDILDTVIHTSTEHVAFSGDLGGNDDEIILDLGGF